jgi:hypothetical protein
MKKLILVLVVCSHAWISMGMGSGLPVQSADIEKIATPTGNGTGPILPWPWGYESPFPWTMVQGVWAVEYNSFKSYFVFRVIKKGYLSQLEVKQVDPVTCEILATGIGFEQERTVRAQMSGKNGSIYRVALRSFSEKLISEQVGVKPVGGQYVVISVIPFDTSKTTVLPMQLISNRLSYRCKVQQ